MLSTWLNRHMATIPGTVATWLKEMFFVVVPVNFS
jgi:hypothetical protein